MTLKKCFGSNKNNLPHNSEEVIASESVSSTVLPHSHGLIHVQSQRFTCHLPSLMHLRSLSIIEENGRI